MNDLNILGDLLISALVDAADAKEERDSMRNALVAIEDMAQFNADSAHWLPVIRELARKTLEPK